MLFRSYFMTTLKPLPGRQLSGFTITLSQKVLDQLDDIELSDDSKEEKILEKLEKHWNEKNLSERIKVEFVYDDGENGAEDPVMFSVWFAGKLAKRYLSWCKRDLLAKNEKLAAISKAASYNSCTTKKRQRDSDAESNSRPTSTSRFSGMNLEEFQKHIKGYSMGQLAEIYGNFS